MCNQLMSNNKNSTRFANSGKVIGKNFIVRVKSHRTRISHYTRGRGLTKFSSCKWGYLSLHFSCFQVFAIFWKFLPFLRWGKKDLRGGKTDMGVRNVLFPKLWCALFSYLQDSPLCLNTDENQVLLYFRWMKTVKRCQ